jgi:hypothetical protein
MVAELTIIYINLALLKVLSEATLYVKGADANLIIVFVYVDDL